MATTGIDGVKHLLWLRIFREDTHEAVTLRHHHALWHISPEALGNQELFLQNLLLGESGDGLLEAAYVHADHGQGRPGPVEFLGSVGQLLVGGDVAQYQIQKKSRVELVDIVTDAVPFGEFQGRCRDGVVQNDHLHLVEGSHRAKYQNVAPYCLADGHRPAEHGVSSGLPGTALRRTALSQHLLEDVIL